MNLNSTKPWYLYAAVAAVCLLGRPAHADLTLGLTPTSAVAGGSGVFDVTLADSGGVYNVAGFTFELSVPGGSGISFTNADMNTSGTYIFSGNSFDTANSLPFSLNAFPTTDVSANDTPITGATSLTTGSTFDLGHIYYAVAPGTPLGPVTVSIVDPGSNTSLADSLANSIAFTANNGSVQVVSAVPEPGVGAMLGGLAVAFGGVVRRGRACRRVGS